MFFRKFFIIGIMIRLMVIAENFNAVNACFYGFHEKIFILIEGVERMCQDGKPTAFMNFLNTFFEIRKIHINVEIASFLTFIPEEIHRSRITSFSTGYIVLEIFNCLILWIVENAFT